MKRSLALLLTLVMSLGLLAGCGSKDTTCLLYTSDAADE